MRPAPVLLCWVCCCCLAACGGDDGGGGGSGGGSGSGGSGASGGGGGTGGAGGAPGPCTPTAGECYVAGPSGPGHECLAKADNTGAAKWQGRLTSILVKAPAALAGEFIQTNVIDKGISLNQPDTCFESGDGTFTWLYEIDPTTKIMKTGGSLPVTDPKAGGCFVSLPGAAVPVAPIEVPVTVDADSQGFSAKDIDVNVPIFLSPTDIKNPIILPLNKVALSAKFNDGTHNCVGKFNGDELDPINSCMPDTKSIPPQRSWTTAGTLKGFITPEQADAVMLDQLKVTLCVVLAPAEWKGPNGDCKSSDKWIKGERPPGDWCSATNDASCAVKDAWLLEGDFSAAGFKINGNCP